MGKNKYQALAGNMLILTIGQFSSKLLVYVMLNFYTSKLGQAGFGTMNIIVSTAGLLISVVTLSIADGVLRFALEKNNDGKMVYSIGVNVCIVGCLIFAVFIPVLGMVPMLEGYEWLMYIYVCMGAVKEVSGIYVRCRYQNGVKLYAVDGILTTVSTVLFNLLFLGVFNMGVVGYVLAVIIGDISSLIFLNAVTKLYKQYHPFRNDKLLRRAMLRYSIPLMPTMIMWAIINNSDMYMVEGFISAEANGIYTFAYKFPNLVTIVVGIFAQAWRMTAITERNSRTTSIFYSNTLSMQQTMMFLTCGGIMLILRPIIIPFFGDESFSSAYFYVPTLLFATIFQAMDNFLSSIYEAARKTSHAMISSLIGAVANILLNLILIRIPALGIEGAAIATLASYVIVFIYRIIDTKKYLYMTIYWPKIIVNLLLLLSMAFSIMFTNYGTVQNVMNAVFFIAIAALNFKSCVQAVEAVLNKHRGKPKEE